MGTRMFTSTKMLKFAWLLLIITLLVNPSWTCGTQSESESDDNFLIEDPVEGPDYDQDYGQSAIDNRGTDRVIICRIEVLTSTGLRSSAKRSFNIPRRGIVVKSVKVYGNCRWELKDRSGRRTEVIGSYEEKDINMTVKRGTILVD